MKKWEKAVHKAMGKRESYGHVVHDDGKIRVHYYDENIDKELDAKLTRAMAKAGYKWYASGYLFSESRRDNCFEMAHDEGAADVGDDHVGEPSFASISLPDGVQIME